MADQRTRATLALIAAGALSASVRAQCGDYDDNGRDDLPVVVGFEIVDGIPGAGALNLIYGTANGLSAAGDQYFDRATPGFAGDPATNALLGGALASGDFDNDGVEDLAVGFGLDTIDGAVFAGSVSVLYGSNNGITLQGDQLLHRNVPGVRGDALASEFFGFALAAGDFDGDGFDDLAVGAWGDSLEGAVPLAGSVHIFYGSGSGLRVQGDQVFSQETSGVRGTPMPNERFGFALDAGDFDDDGRDDLAIGIHLDYVGAVQGGSVAVLYGSNSGLSASGDDLFNQDSDGVANVAATNDRFGWWVSAGDFDGDGHDDLAVGVPFETVGGVAAAGAVAVFYGSSSGGGGLSTDGDQLWHQNKSGVQDSPEFNERFGLALAVGDFDGDGFDDLAVGMPLDSVALIEQAGSVQILYGSSQGIHADGDQLLHQNAPGVAGTAAVAEWFGASLYSGDFDGDGRDDLAVSAPFETVGLHDGAGSVTVFYGSNNGVSVSGEQVFTQDTQGIKDEAADDEWFGLYTYYRIIV